MNSRNPSNAGDKDLFLLSSNHHIEKMELDSFLTEQDEFKSLKSPILPRKGIRSGAISPINARVPIRSMFSKQNSLKFDKLDGSQTPTIIEYPRGTLPSKELDFRKSKLDKLLAKFKALQYNEDSPNSEIFTDSFVDIEYYDEMVKNKDYTQILECLLSFVTHSKLELP